MTTVVLASSYLSGSLLAMLVPIATVIVIVAWGVVLIRRHELGRRDDDPAGRSATGADAAQGSRSSRER